MNDTRQLLRVMARQLYMDIRFVTERNPTQVVDDEGAKTYNALLGRLRAAFPNVEALADFGDWSPRTIKYKDALIVAGQLNALIAAALAPEGQTVVPPAARPDSADPGGNPAGGDYEQELYGSDPVKRRPDGTIPFSLHDE